VSTETNIIAVTFGQATTPKQDLGVIAGRIVAHVHAAQQAGLTVLGHLLDAGDALIEAQQHVSSGWKNWLRANCDLKVSTAQLCQQLARSREKIEAEIARKPELSLRAARRLIAKPKPKIEEEESTAAVTPGNGVPADDVEDQINKWNGWGPEERKAFLNGILLEDFLAVMPADWKPEIERRALSSLAAKAPTAKTKSAIKKVGKLVEGTRLLDMKPEGSA
jgi:hypothetical protein